MPSTIEKSKLHILLPSTQGNVKFCKTLMTMTLLGYPAPTIIGWGFEDSSNGLKGGGSHYMKITNSLAYIENHERNGTPDFEEEVVFMLDAYDIWFQLPVETLLARYEKVLREENARVAHRMGKAYHNEKIESGVIFGAGKRCIPNMPYTISCYPVPDSPVPHDVYGDATDSQFGVSSASAYRARYLNSGFIIGKVKFMRPLLKKAQEKMEICKDQKPREDDVRNWSGHCYSGSDQSIFNEMLGEQEYHREVMRRHHRGIFDDMLDKMIPGRAGAWPKPYYVYGALVKDPLSPEFPHNQHNTTLLPGKPFEFGMALDYFYDLGHQAINAERDVFYVKHDKPLKGQLGRFSPFDCRNMRSNMPDDIPSGNVELLAADPSGPKTWKQVQLMSEVCVDTVPVMIHHNAMNKKRIETEWSKPWWHGRSRKLMEYRKNEGAEALVNGFKTDSETVKKLTWDELCPAEYDEELYRDVKETKA